MKKDVFKKSGWSTVKQSAVPLLFTVGVLVMIMIGLNETERSSRAEGKRILEESLWRATVTCYAIEGRYPANLGHIETVYGVHIDRTRYAVFYEIMASNMMPVITVLESGIGSAESSAPDGGAT